MRGDVTEWQEQFEAAGFTDEQKRLIHAIVAHSVLGTVDAMRLDVAEYFADSILEVINSFGLDTDATPDS